MQLPWMSWSDRRRWRSAHTVADLGELMALWLEGELRSWPGHMPGCGPDRETTHLVPSLAALNRAGFLTIASQPGEAGTGHDGLWWQQRAAVEGFVSDRTLYYRLLEVAEAASLTVAVDDSQSDVHDTAVTVTTVYGEPYTAFGGRLSNRDMQAIWPVIRKQAFASLATAVRLTIAAPEPGVDGERLWPVLDFVTGLRQHDSDNPWNSPAPAAPARER
ncbi:DUF6919 domain-containing protein [Streptomyces sp. NPDC127178]|uniref:DUF6919 domain-containing protein n=1 Tax=unclassified Streptomyces TaxID=2593676 RepID=UPI0036352A81